MFSQQRPTCHSRWSLDARERRGCDAGRCLFLPASRGRAVRRLLGIRNVLKAAAAKDLQLGVPLANFNLVNDQQSFIWLEWEKEIR